jgi:hypothetical protein
MRVATEPFWTHTRVRVLLANTAYIGRPAWNKASSGNYTEYTNGGRVDHKPGRSKPYRPHPETDWVQPRDPIFDPTVPLPVWDKVQEKLRAAKQRRSPRSPDLWLAGLLYCGNCGARMVGTKRPHGARLAARVFEAMTQDRRRILRLLERRREEPLAAVFDSRTLQSTPESGHRAGYDGAKGKEGSEVHMIVGTLGHLLSLHVTAPSEQDREQVGKLARDVQKQTGRPVELAYFD